MAVAASRFSSGTHEPHEVPHLRFAGRRQGGIHMRDALLGVGHCAFLLGSRSWLLPQIAVKVTLSVSINKSLLPMSPDFLLLVSAVGHFTAALPQPDGNRDEACAQAYRNGQLMRRWRNDEDEAFSLDER